MNRDDSERSGGGGWGEHGDGVGVGRTQGPVTARNAEEAGVCWGVRDKGNKGKT